MKISRWFAFLLVLLLTTALVACERSLGPTTGPAPTPTELSGVPPAETGEVMDRLEQFATQTAMATMGIPPQPTGETLPGDQATPVAPGGDTTPVAPVDTQPAPVSPDPTNPPPTPEPTLPAVVVPTATPGLPTTYVLKSGEFPFCIARRLNVNQYELLSASGLSLNSQPAAGYELRIPQSGNPFEGSRSRLSHPATHTVQAGETIYSIACSYGDVSPDAIAFANNLSAPYDLQVGQRIQIP